MALSKAQLPNHNKNAGVGRFYKNQRSRFIRRQGKKYLDEAPIHKYSGHAD